MRGRVRGRGMVGKKLILPSQPPPPKVKPTPSSKPLFLRFHDVTEEALTRMEAAQSRREVREILKECMKIDQAEGLRTEILADMHYHNFAFCQARGFSAEKTSTFLSVMRLVLEEAVSRRLTVDGALDVFKEWLLKHGVERSPYSIGLFPFDEVQALTEYAHNSFFRHYRLYMYVYMTHRDLDIRLDEEVVGLSSPPPRFAPLPALGEVDPQILRELPVLAQFFTPEPSVADDTGKEDQPEDRAALVKRKVEEGTRKLMERFEEKLNEQDTRFQAALAAGEKGHHGHK